MSLNLLADERPAPAWLITHSYEDRDAGVLKSGKEAVVQARKVQEQLSLSANYEKAEARKRQEAETRTWMPWIWGAVAVALGSMLVRSLYRRRA